MASAFIIEIAHNTAGVAICERGGYRFHASDPLFRRLDGRKFRHLKNIHTAVADIVDLALLAEAGSLSNFVGKRKRERAKADPESSDWLAQFGFARAANAR